MTILTLRPAWAGGRSGRLHPWPGQVVSTNFCVAIVATLGRTWVFGICRPFMVADWQRTMDEVLHNAVEGVAIYAEELAKDGRPLPAPRSIAALRNDPAAAPDIRDHMVALVSLSVDSAHAAE